MSRKPSTLYYCQLSSCPGLHNQEDKCHVRRCQAPKQPPPPLPVPKHDDVVEIRPKVAFNSAIQASNTPTVTTFPCEIVIMVPVGLPWDEVTIQEVKFPRSAFQQIGDIWLHKGRQVHRFQLNLPAILAR